MLTYKQILMKRLKHYQDDLHRLFFITIKCTARKHLSPLLVFALIILEIIQMFNLKLTLYILNNTRNIFVLVQHYKISFTFIYTFQISF